jgi:ATP-dependent Clp protease ATP-binding subunit ClpA
MGYLGTDVESVRKQSRVTLKSKTQIDVSPGFHTLLSLAANKARSAGSDTVNLLHFLQVMLEPANKAEMTLLKEGGLDVEKALVELVQRFQSNNAEDAADS